MRFTNTELAIRVRYTTGANTFHHVKLMNHAIIISHCTILVGVKTECNILFYFQGLYFCFALQSSHFKILNIAFAYATNKGLYKKPINISKYRKIIPDPLSTTGSTIRRNAVDLKILMNISDQLHV